MFGTNNPVIPSIILTDRDVGQINALRSVFPSSRILLCWWHVLHNWYGQLSVKDHPEAWELLKQFPRQTTRQDHEKVWQKLQAILPQTFIEYMYENWLKGEYQSIVL